MNPASLKKGNINEGKCVLLGNTRPSIKLYDFDQFPENHILERVETLIGLFFMLRK